MSMTTMMSEEHEAEEGEEDVDTAETAEEVEVAHGIVTPDRLNRKGKTSGHVSSGAPTADHVLMLVAAASAVASATSRLVEGRSRDLGLAPCGIAKADAARNSLAVASKPPIAPRGLTSTDRLSR